MYTISFWENLRGFFKKIKKLIPILILLLLIAIFSLDSFYTIKEQEQAVVITFGKAKTVKDAGLHLKIPLIQKVEKVDTTIKGFPIGYDEYTNETVESEAVMITRDFNFVNVDFFVEYKVADPVKFLYASSDPVTILKNIAQSNIVLLTKL